MCGIVSYGGDIQLKSGNLNTLRTESKITIKFDYSELVFGAGEWNKERLAEEEYISMVTSILNDRKSDMGNSWKQQWFENRDSMYHPDFIKAFNKVGGKTIIPDSNGCKYTLVVKAGLMNPGFLPNNNETNTIGKNRNEIVYRYGRAFIEFRFSLISADTITLFETEPRVIIQVKKDDDGRYYWGERVSEVYKEAGKDLAKFFLKNLK